MEKKETRGAPMKIPLMGETHKFTPNKIPKELAYYFKLAIKDMFGTLTLSDYLRYRVINDSRKKLKGKVKTTGERNYGGLVDWSLHPWCKTPKRSMYGLSVHYPKNRWTIFLHNCSVKGVSPKHEIQRYMIEIVEEWIIWRKMQKAKEKKK